MLICSESKPDEISESDLQTTASFANIGFSEKSNLFLSYVLSFLATIGATAKTITRRASPHAQKIAKGVYPTHFKVPAEKSIKQLIGTKSNNRVRETTAHTQIAFTMIINLFILHVLCDRGTGSDRGTVLLSHFDTRRLLSREPSP